MSKESKSIARTPLEGLDIYKIFRQHLFLTGCILFLITLPFPTRFNNLAIIVMALGWLIDGNFKTKCERFRRTKLGWAIFSFFAVCLASVLYSGNLEDSYSKMETKIGLLIMPLIIYSASLSLEGIRVILKTFVIAAFFTSLYCLGCAFSRYMETGDMNNFFYQWLTLPLHMSAIYYANILCLTVIIMLLYKDQPQFLPPWKLYLIPTITIFILMLAALSVTGFLITLGIIYAWFLLRKRFSTITSLLTVAAGAFIFAAIMSVFPYTKLKIEKMSNLHYEMNYPDSMWNTITIRLAKWKGASAVIQQNPILGVGIGDQYDELMKSYSKLNFSEGLRNTYNEHNQYLASLVATGIPGLLALLYMLFLPMIKSIQYRDYLFTAFLSLMIFSFMTENFLYIQKGVLFFAFFYALFVKRLVLRQNLRPLQEASQEQFIQLSADRYNNRYEGEKFQLPLREHQTARK